MKVSESAEVWFLALELKFHLLSLVGGMLRIISGRARRRLQSVQSVQLSTVYLPAVMQQLRPPARVITTTWRLGRVLSIIS